MDFLTVNNNICTKCNECLKQCPKNAINITETGCSIDFSKCVLCGICFKVCKQNAIKLNIPIDKINYALQGTNQIEELKESVQQLTSLNQFLNEKIKTLNSRFKVLVSKLNEAVVVVDNNGKIAFTNDHFTDMLSLRNKEMLRRGNRIEGMDIHYFLTQDLYRQVLSVQTRGKDISWIETNIEDTVVTASIYSIKRGDYTIIILRDMDNPIVSKDQAVKQLQMVINQNMAMVQKIGFLLGEEVSETSTLLYQTINSLSSKSEK